MAPIINLFHPFAQLCTPYMQTFPKKGLHSSCASCLISRADSPFCSAAPFTHHQGVGPKVNPQVNGSISVAVPNLRHKTARRGRAGPCLKVVFYYLASTGAIVVAVVVALFCPVPLCLHSMSTVKSVACYFKGHYGYGVMPAVLRLPVTLAEPKLLVTSRKFIDRDTLKSPMFGASSF
jgi:hypothetical protein